MIAVVGGVKSVLFGESVETGTLPSQLPQVATGYYQSPLEL